MNSNECKLIIKVCYKDKHFEDESNDIIPLQQIKEKAIKKFDIKKEDEEFINFEYHSIKENKSNPIENENNIIQYSNEDSSGNLFCNLELVINNPKRESKEKEHDKLSNEFEAEKIKSEKSSHKNINEINDKVKRDIKQDEKEIYENEINKLKLEIEKINENHNLEFANLKKENLEKEKKNENLINSLEKNIKNKENEITNINSEINNIKKELEKINSQNNNIENAYNNNHWNEFIEKANKSYDNLLKINSTFEEIIKEIKLNKKILSENRNENNEEKKEMNEIEKNKNIELIKSVIKQMKLEENNEVIEKYKKLEEENKKLGEENKILEEDNKKLEEENKMHKNKIKEMEIQIKDQMTFSKSLFEKMNNDYEEIKENINSLFFYVNTIETGINKNEKMAQDKIGNNEKNEKKRSFFPWGKNKNKNENIKIDNKIKNSNINNNNEDNFFKPQISNEINNSNILFDWSKENKINNNPNININELYNKDKYNNLSEQLKSFYGSNISNEKILKILNKIKEIIPLVQ